MTSVEEQDQVNTPPAALAGVKVRVTAAPTEEAREEPATCTTPAELTVAPVTFPTAAKEQAAATLEGTPAPLLAAVASAMQARGVAAAATSSLTLARIV